MATINEWLPIASFILSCAIAGGGVIWGVGKIKQEVTDRIAAESLSREKALAAAVESRNQQIDNLLKDFHDAQRTQDHNVGEMGAALRRFIESVKEEVHEVEIWGRDNYVQKGEFEKATDRLEEAIKGFAAEIKTDIRSLTAKIDAKH